MTLTHDRYASPVDLEPNAGDTISIRLTVADWITIRSCLGDCACKEESYSRSVKDNLLKFEAQESVRKIKRIDDYIRSHLQRR